MDTTLKIIFMGTPDIAVPSLEALHAQKDISITLVVSMPDRASGRGKRLRSPDVVLSAKKMGLKVHQSPNINKDVELWNLCSLLKPDIIIVFAFAQFLSEKFLQLPSIGCFNIHTSLLPKYRGAAPIVYCILNGDRETGVTIQKMVKKMDAGDIAHNKRIPISNEETGETLAVKLKKLSVGALLEFKNKIQDRTLSYIPQDEASVSFAPALRKEDGLIDFVKFDFVKIDAMVRALQPWPGAYTFLNGQRLKIFKIQKAQIVAEPAEVVVSEEGLIIGCAGGSVRASEIQLQGKKRCRDVDILNGLKNRVAFLEVSTVEG